MILLVACVSVSVDSDSTSIDGDIGHAAIYHPFGSLVVNGTANSGHADFRWTARYDGDPPLINIAAENGIVTSQVDCGTNQICLVDMEATLPPEISLETALLNGDIQISSLAGEVLASTTEGTIHLEKLSGNVTASSETGDIFGTDLSSPGLYVGGTTGNRDLRFSAIPLSVEVNSQQGDLDLEVPAGPYTVTADGTTVEVTGLSEDPTNTHTISATTASGAVRISGI